MQKFNKLLSNSLVFIQFCFSASLNSIDLNNLSHNENLFRATTAYKMHKRFGFTKLRPQLNNNVTHGQGFNNNQSNHNHSNNLAQNQPQNNLNNVPQNNNLNQMQQQGQLHNINPSQGQQLVNPQELKGQQGNQVQNINGQVQNQIAQCPTCKQQVYNNGQFNNKLNQLPSKNIRPVLRKRLPFNFRKKRRFR